MKIYICAREFSLEFLMSPLTDQLAGFILSHFTRFATYKGQMGFSLLYTKRFLEAQWQRRNQW